MNATIVSVSSPAGNSLKGIVRLSGSQAFRLVQRVADKSIGSKCGWNAVTVTLRINQSQIPARLYLMKAPRSYTREDVAEIHTIGSRVLLEAILEYFISRGARLARPGEFTQRAFLNGRLNLAQAEAVLDIIHSSSEQEHCLAVSRLHQHSFMHLKEINQQLLGLAARMELALDFSDQDIEIIPPKEVGKIIGSILKALRAVLQAGAKGRLVSSDGVLCVLCGRPNVGKSSLFNRLVKDRRNIVSPVSGTTRDYIEGRFSHKGAAFRIFDTAGILTNQPAGEAKRSPDEYRDQTEQISHLQPDLYLFVIDASIGLTKQDLAILKQLGSKRTLLITNKMDLLRNNSAFRIPHSAFCACSALTNEGIVALKDMLVQKVKASPPDRFTGQALINLRQQEDLKKCLGHLTRAGKSLAADNSYDIIALDILEALDRLNACLGSFSAGKTILADDILNNIFSRFCIGK